VRPGKALLVKYQTSKMATLWEVGASGRSWARWKAYGKGYTGLTSMNYTAHVPFFHMI
jgi:hypothetical protein